MYVYAFKIYMHVHAYTVEYQKFAQLGTRDCVDFRILWISGH